MPKILIADDNNNIQKMVSLAFEERGIEVVSVGNGEAAVRRLAEMNPDIVLADIFMPVRSGYEVCEYIKKDQRFSHIPVILLVGAFDPLDEKEARRVGADGVLKKPFVPPDPLIAMVTSVLEKNPKIAAELAKAKEAAVVEPPPLPEPEVAAKITPRPLPEFPEPTPEEAAMLYGFGSGRRATFEDEEEIAVTEPHFAAEVEDDEEGAETSRDWRRAAMEFEVPQEVGAQAFSDETVFSSDADASRPVQTAASEGTLKPTAPVESAVESRTESTAPFAMESVAEERPFFAPPAGEASAPALPANESNSESSAILATSAPSVTDEREISVVEDVPPVEQSAGEPLSVAQTPQVPHWMDALSAEPPAGDWMAGLTKKQPEPENFDLQEVAPPALNSAPTSEPDAPKILAAEPEIVESAPPAVAQSSSAADSFFADDHANDSANSSWFAPSPAAFDPSAEAAKPEEGSSSLLDVTPVMSHATQDGAFRRDPNLVEPPAVRVVPEPLLDADETEFPASVSLRDPGLIGEPAVRVNPEPLLDAEESQPVSQVPLQREELDPAYSPQPADFSPAADASSEPTDDFREISATEFGERIPTGPPPNREALAGIPFLTPPPNFHPDSPTEPEVSDQTVDAVVQRVLEKLEPQLHALLSQGVLKPLVENLLQGELAKKNH